MKTKLNPNYQLKVTFVNSDCGLLIRSEFIDNSTGCTKVRFADNTISVADDLFDALYNDVYSLRSK